MKRFNLFAVALLVLAVAALGIFPPAHFASAASDQGYSGFSAKTAAYTLTAADSGVTFTNRGASGSVTITLPAVSRDLHFKFVVVAAQAFVVAADTADTLISYNDLDLDSVSSNTIGAQMEVICDGTSWILLAPTVGVTYTFND